MSGVESRSEAIAMVCEHVKGLPAHVKKSGDGCVECLELGLEWVHLRECLVCGHVGCCDSSIGRHATGHFHTTRHLVMRSVEPGESWRWCYVHEAMV